MGGIIEKGEGSGGEEGVRRLPEREREERRVEDRTGRQRRRPEFVSPLKPRSRVWRFGEWETISRQTVRQPWSPKEQ